MNITVAKVVRDFNKWVVAPFSPQLGNGQVSLVHYEYPK